MRQITISGNIGKDTELRTTSNGGQVANFNVAVRQNRADDTGQYGTDWFRCSVWGKRAQTVEKYFKKGSHVSVTGSLEVSEYNGKTQLGVNVSDFDLPDNQRGNNTNNTAPQANNNPFTNNGQSIDIDDNDLPF